MRLISLAAVAAVCLVTFAPAVARDSDGKASEPKQETAEAPKPRKICRRIQNTGFRTAARQCKTQQQWDQLESEGASDTEMRMKSGQVNPG